VFYVTSLRPGTDRTLSHFAHCVITTEWGKRCKLGNVPLLRAPFARPADWELAEGGGNALLSDFVSYNGTRALHVEGYATRWPHTVNVQAAQLASPLWASSRYASTPAFYPGEINQTHLEVAKRVMLDRFCVRTSMEHPACLQVALSSTVRARLRLLQRMQVEWLVGFSDCLGSLYRRIAQLQGLTVHESSVSQLQKGAIHFESRRSHLSWSYSGEVMNLVAQQNSIDNQLFHWARNGVGEEMDVHTFVREGCPYHG